MPQPRSRAQPQKIASAYNYAPRPNTPRAVLVADLPPPLAPEVPATAESNEA